MGVVFLFIAGSLSLTSCKKDNSTSNSDENSITSQQTIQVQNSDAQDALADKTEEDVDNNLEELQNNNYSTSSSKSALSGPTDTLVITVDYPDTIHFPKVVTLTYYSYQDSCANESIIKNGEIKVTISCPDISHPRLITRAFEFDNFAITTDSTTVIINGTRTVKRLKDAIKFNGLASARIAVTDSITSDMKFAVATTGSTDTLTFTRNVSKLRTAIAHYRNVNFKLGDLPYNLTHLRFKHIPSFDSLTYSGSVTGFNERDSAYTKTITSTLIITVFKGSLVISSGTMTYTVGSNSYDISFAEDPAHKHLTLVTVTNNQTGKTKSFDRRFGRVFKKWW